MACMPTTEIPILLPVHEKHSVLVVIERPFQTHPVKNQKNELIKFKKYPEML